MPGVWGGPPRTGHGVTRAGPPQVVRALWGGHGTQGRVSRPLSRRALPPLPRGILSGPLVPRRRITSVHTDVRPARPGQPSGDAPFARGGCAGGRGRGEAEEGTGPCRSGGNVGLGYARVLIIILGAPAGRADRRARPLRPAW